MDVSEMKIGALPPDPREISKKTRTTPSRSEKEETAKDVAVLKGKKDSPGIMKRAKMWVKANVTGDAKASEHPVSDYQDRTGLMVGAGAGIGGAVGTAVGAYAGMQEAKNDVAQVQWQKHDVNDPSLEGYTHHVYEDGHYEKELVGYQTVRDLTGYDENNNPIYSEHQEPIYHEHWEVDGYWHRFSPDINERKVGEYQTPEYEHSSWLNPISGALVGLLGGTAIGAGIASGGTISYGPGASVPNIFVTISGAGGQEGGTLMSDFIPPSPATRTNLIYWKDKRLE